MRAIEVRTPSPTPLPPPPADAPAYQPAPSPAPAEPAARRAARSRSGSGEVSRGVAEPVSRLPVKIDKSSTSALVLQLERFEARNNVAEAFLLANELVRRYPQAVFAYDAAIRNALILQLDADVENYYQAAIRAANPPGRYYVQLAHFYQRRGKADNLSALIQQYATTRDKDADFLINLARLYAVTQDAAKAQETLEKAVADKAELFPLILMASQLYREVNLPEKGVQTVLEAMDRDFGPWEKRTLLQELLKFRNLKAEDVGRMVHAALVNETSYERASNLANSIMDRTLELRVFLPLKNWLLQRMAAGESSDIQIWLAAVMALREGNEEEALKLLTDSRAGNTPVISFERALALSRVGRHVEAFELFYELLSEQPDVLMIRLAVAREMLSLEMGEEALEILAPVPRDELSQAERTDLCDILIRAALDTGKPEIILNTWTEVANLGEFPDVVSAGDLIVDSSTTASLRQELREAAGSALAAGGAPSLLLLRARLNAADSEHNLELEDYSKYIELVPDNAALMRYVAELCLQHAESPIELLGAETTEGDPIVISTVDTQGTDLATALYRRLIELQPGLPDNYSSLMRSYLMRGESENAKSVALELADRNSSSAETLAQAAAILEDNGFLTESIPLYRRALQQNSHDFQTWVRYAGALRASGRTADADAIYRRILEVGLRKRPYNQPAVFASLLKLSRDSDRVAELIEYLDSLRGRTIPGKEEFYLSAAKLLMEIAALDRAEAFLREFVSLYPESSFVPDAYLLLGQIMVIRGEFAQAETVYEEAARIFAGQQPAVAAQLLRAAMLQRTGRYEDAVMALLQVAQRHPSDDQALAGLYSAAVLSVVALGNQDQGVSLFERYLDSTAQDFELRARARDNVQRLRSGRPLAEAEEPAPSS